MVSFSVRITAPAPGDERAIGGDTRERGDWRWAESSGERAPNGFDFEFVDQLIQAIEIDAGFESEIMRFDFEARRRRRLDRDGGAHLSTMMLALDDVKMSRDPAVNSLSIEADKASGPPLE